MSENRETSAIILLILVVGIAIGVGGSLIFGLFRSPIIEQVEWPYPVRPFTFVTDTPPDDALRVSTLKNASNVYYDVYVWKITFLGGETRFYWTYRMVTAP